MFISEQELLQLEGFDQPALIPFFSCLLLLKLQPRLLCGVQEEWVNNSYRPKGLGAERTCETKKMPLMNRLGVEIVIKKR